MAVRVSGHAVKDKGNVNEERDRAERLSEGEASPS